MSERLSFGLVLPSAADALAPRVDALVQWLGERSGLRSERRSAPTYEALADDVRGGRVDLAWLPPIVLVRLGDAVHPLGSVVRGGKSTYEAALIVRADSKIKTIDALRGMRAGWVDPWSAAGFVLPRVKLALLGVDPRKMFRAEKFHGSHRAAIEALLEGACDVVGTYARTDDDGQVVAGAWSDIPGADMRVLATFGAIPPDVLATRRDLAPPVRDKVLAALRAACSDVTARVIVRDIFGGDELDEGPAPGYESLKKALDMAAGRGLFD